MKYAVVNKKTYQVENVIEIEAGSTWEPPKGCMLVEGATASLGDTWDGEGFIRPDRVLTPEEQADELRREAVVLLKESDITVLRAFEDGTVLPDEWKEYRAVLRAIVSTGSGEIPSRPQFPA